MLTFLVTVAIRHDRLEPSTIIGANLDLDPLAHVDRGRIVLLTGDAVGTRAFLREVGCAKATVWRWQERFVEAGVDRLLRDKSRPRGKTPLPRTVVERVVELTLGEPPGEATHWTGRAMAAAAGRCARA